MLWVGKTLASLIHVVGATHHPATVTVMVADETTDAEGLLGELGELSIPCETMTPAEVIGNLTHEEGVTAPDPRLREQLKLLIAEIRAAYYQDRPEDAAALIATAAQLLERDTTAPTDLRVAVRLWAAAIALDQDQGKARSLAVEALRADPGLVVDINTYRPSVRDFVESVRPTLGGPAVLTIVGLPQMATVWIDGSIHVRRPITLFPGAYRLVVEAPHMQRITMDVSVAAQGHVVRVPIALSSVSAEKIMAGIYDTVLLEAVATDCFLAATPMGTRLACRQLRPQSLTQPLSVPELARWVAARLPTQTPPPQTPSAIAQGEPVAAPQRSSSLAASLGPSVRLRTSMIKSATGERLTTRSLGLGSAADVRYSYAWAGLRARIHWLYEGLSTSTVELPVTGAQQISGRYSIDAQLLATLTWDLSAVRVLLGAGGSAERAATNDARDAAGNLGLLPSWQLWSVDLTTDAEIRLGNIAVGDLWLSAGGGISPYTLVRESPAGASGASPEPTMAPLWRASLGLRDRWLVALVYEGTWRTTRFSGEATFPYSPPFSDSIRTQMSHLLSIGGGLAW